MPPEHTTSIARIPVVRLVGGSPRWPNSKKYEVVAHATVDEADVEFLSQHTWTLAKDHKTDYANRSVWTGDKTIKIQMHREVWERHNGRIPDGFSVDHEDRNGLNNTTANLRIADRVQQQANQSLYRNSKTGFKGVCWVGHAQKFQVGIRRSSKSLHFGWYSTAEEAAFVYNHVARKMHGDFAWINPIPDEAIDDRRKSELIAEVEGKFFPRHGITD